MPDFDIITMINNPAGLDNEIIDEVSSLILKYPYFNTAYFLKARALKNIKSAEFTDFLGLAATYAINRRKLYDYINASYGGKIEKIKQEPEKIFLPLEIENIAGEEAKTRNREIIYTPAQPEQEEIQAVPEKSNIIDYTKTTLSKELKNHIAETVKRQLSQAEDNINIELKIIPGEYNINTPVSRQKEKKQDVSALPDNSFISDSLLELDIEENKGMKQNYAAFTLDEPDAGSKENTLDQNRLIDNFIQTNPRIVVREADQLEYKDISESSVNVDDNLFTETLAKIYIQQGNYAKAIFAYEKLILKYPEKKAYFASQIENIKNKINE